MLLQIECALTQLALYNRPSVFSNKLYAEKYVFFSVMYMAHICARWDALMSFQEALEEGTTDRSGNISGNVQYTDEIPFN